MNTNFEIAAAAYLFVGTLLGTIGPLWPGNTTMCEAMSSRYTT
jgi:hypothetical protein